MDGTKITREKDGRMESYNDRYKNNLPEDGKLNGRHENNSPEGWMAQK